MSTARDLLRRWKSGDHSEWELERAVLDAAKRAADGGGPEAEAAAAVTEAVDRWCMAARVDEDSFGVSSASSCLMDALEEWAEVQDALAGKGHAGVKAKQREAGKRTSYASKAAMEKRLEEFRVAWQSECERGLSPDKASIVAATLCGISDGTRKRYKRLLQEKGQGATTLPPERATPT